MPSSAAAVVASINFFMIYSTSVDFKNAIQGLRHISYVPLQIVSIPVTGSSTGIFLLWLFYVGRLVMAAKHGITWRGLACLYEFGRSFTLLKPMSERI